MKIYNIIKIKKILYSNYKMKILIIKYKIKNIKLIFNNCKVKIIK